jgi:DNA-binding protein HU-beta
MTKTELIQKVYDLQKNDDLTKTAVQKIIVDTFGVIEGAIKKEKRFSMANFGTWTLKARKARKGRNPQTGEVIKIKASKTVGFRPSAGLKGRL